MWLNQIIEQFQQAYTQAEGRIATATGTAMKVLYVKPDDMTGVVNITNTTPHDALLAKLPDHQNAMSNIPKKVKKLNPESLHMFVNGNKFCEITKKGEVWVRGRNVATFKSNGDFIMGGSDTGLLQGNGDWRKAAVVYFFGIYDSVKSIEHLFNKALSK